jgi:hypothetical protein
MNELKSKIAALGKRHHYESWMSEFTGTADEGDMMLDAVTMEEYKQKFTQTNFQEELASYFPLLHKIMSETNTVDLEEYVEEAARPWETDDEAEAREKDDKDDDSTDTTGSDGAEHGGSSRAKHLAKQAMPKEKSAAESIDAFGEWAEAVEQGKLTDDQVQELKTAIEQLPMGAEGPELELGQDGQTAVQFFQGLGLDNSELEEKLKDMANVDPTTDALEVLKLWADESYPELSVALGISDTGEEPAAPEPVAPEPAEQPTEQPTAENDEMSMHKGTTEGGNKSSEMIKMIAERVKSFYNRDNPEVGPFRGEGNIATEIKKECSEKYGDQAGERAYQMAEAFMEKLTNEWHQRHGKVDHGDGLSVDSLKEILGRIKQKVEGISRPEMEGSKDDFRTHGMDSQPSKENPKGNPAPTDYKRDPIAATTDRAYDAGKAALQRLAGIRTK